MELENIVRLVDVSDVPGIAEALDIQWSGRDYEGQPDVDPTWSFCLGTRGALQLTFANGDVIVICTSEFCAVDYYPARKIKVKVA